MTSKFEFLPNTKRIIIKNIHCILKCYLFSIQLSKYFVNIEYYVASIKFTLFRFQEGSTLMDARRFTEFLSNLRI
jgi:hypothetical protein